MNFFFWGNLRKSDMHELSHVGSNVLGPSTAAMILLTKACFSRYRMILPEWRKNGTSNNAFCQGAHSLHHPILYFFRLMTIIFKMLFPQQTMGLWLVLNDFVVKYQRVHIVVLIYQFSELLTIFFSAFFDEMVNICWTKDIYAKIQMLI